MAKNTFTSPIAPPRRNQPNHPVAPQVVEPEDESQEVGGGVEFESVSKLKNQTSELVEDEDEVDEGDSENDVEQDDEDTEEDEIEDEDVEHAKLNGSHPDSDPFLVNSPNARGPIGTGTGSEPGSIATPKRSQSKLTQADMVRAALAAGVEKPKAGVEWIRENFGGFDMRAALFSSQKAQIQNRDEKRRERQGDGDEVEKPRNQVRGEVKSEARSEVRNEPRTHTIHPPRDRQVQHHTEPDQPLQPKRGQESISPARTEPKSAQTPSTIPIVPQETKGSNIPNATSTTTELDSFVDDMTTIKSLVGKYGVVGLRKLVSVVEE